MSTRTTLALDERAALCDTALEVGADAPDPGRRLDA